MGTVLTHTPRMEQLSPRLWTTLDNQLFLLANGRVLFAPRKLVTDNNTNPFGDNDFCDVRASHFHDLGCRYKQLVYVNLTVEELKERLYLRIHKKRSKGRRFDIWVCDDIPSNILTVEDVTFNEINRIFKEILLATGVSKALSNAMRFAVNFNVGWLLSGKVKLDKEKIYRDYL